MLGRWLLSQSRKARTRLGAVRTSSPALKSSQSGVSAHPFTRSNLARMASSQAGRLNRLAQEKSPYLRQHAHNPVDWYPWGEEAFEKAKKENKPIFLSGMLCASDCASAHSCGEYSELELARVSLVGLCMARDCHVHYVPG